MGLRALGVLSLCIIFSSATNALPLHSTDAVKKVNDSLLIEKQSHGKSATAAYTQKTNSHTKDGYLMNRLTLEKANAIIQAALIESKKLSLQPMSIAILDAGGHIIAFQRQDNAAILRFDIAFAKAYGALGMGIGSRGLAIKAKETPDFIAGAIAASGGRLIPAPGGVLIMDNDHHIIGAAGASGDSSDNDERAVIAGILSVGLEPKTN